MDSLLLKEYAILCGISYKAVDEAVKIYETKGYKAKLLVQPLELEQVFSLVKDRKLFIVITGTNQIRDWLVNIFALPGGYIHSGYSSISTALIKPVLDEYALNEVDEIIILGHSKGGGVAAILAGYLSYLPVKVITYGAPRIASEDYASAYPHSIYTRVVHIHDVVSRLPSGLGYRHCGKPIVWDGIEYNDSLKAWIDAQKANPTFNLFIKANRSYKAHISYWL
jgi:predicted lipase